jgi:hypothetical protein
MSRYSGNNFTEGKHILCQLQYTYSYDADAFKVRTDAKKLGPPKWLAVGKIEVKSKGLKIAFCLKANEQQYVPPV